MEHLTPLSLRILCVDTNDTCKSYIAKEIFKQFFENIPVEFHIETAGILAKTATPATPAAIAALEGQGITPVITDFKATAIADFTTTVPFDIVFALDTTVDKRHQKNPPQQPSDVLENNYRHLYHKMVIWAGVEPYKYIHSETEEKEKKYNEAVEKLLRKIREWTAKWLKNQNFSTDKITLYTGVTKQDMKSW